MINVVLDRALVPLSIFVFKWKNIVLSTLILFFIYIIPAHADEFDNAYKLISKNNLSGAIAQLEPLAKNGNIKAQITIAMFYMEPKIKNVDMAKHWLSIAANKNSAEAQEMLGNLIMCGETTGIQKECYGDFSSGRRWLESAFSQYQQRAKNGDCSGYERMANFYLDGKIVPKDAMKGVVMLKTAGQCGDVQAASRLASLYTDDVDPTFPGFPIDYIKGYAWSIIAAYKAKDYYASSVRERIETSLSPQQIRIGQQIANECLETNFQRCKL